MMRDIRNMEDAWVKVTGGNFPLSEYKDKSGRKSPEYKLNKPEALYVASKYNNEIDRPRPVFSVVVALTIRLPLSKSNDPLLYVVTPALM